MLQLLLALAPLALVAPALGEECEEVVPPQFLQKSLQLQQEGNIVTDAKQSKSSSVKKSEGEVQTYHFYANFHGVDPVLATLMNVLHGAGASCSTCGLHLFSCEEEGLNATECMLRDAAPCLSQPVSCSRDSGLKVLEAGIIGQDFSSVNTSDFSSLKNLWADRKRYNLLAGSALASQWLPMQWGFKKRVLITTILRDPVERLRSVFYSLSPDHSPEKFKDFMKVQQTMAWQNETSEGWPWRKAIEGCCEYSHYLGICDVEKSKKVLVSQFDFVGIAESMPETLVALAWLYGKTPEGMGILARDTRLKVPEPEEWDADDLAVAKNVTAKDQEVYNFGKELFRRQAISMWNNEDVLKKQAKKLEDAWNTPWEPE